MKAKVLVVDDDRELLESAELLLRKDFDVKTAASVESAKAQMLQSEFDVAVVDLNFEGSDEDGIDLLNFISRRVSNVEVVVLSGDQVTARIVEAMKRNLVDFIPKSGEYGTALKLAITRGLERKHQRNQRMSEHRFLTASPKMFALLRVVHKISENPGQFSILINGETGTGKEVLAKYMAALMAKPIVAANMASLPKDTAEAELFGYARGAFTGAVASKPGLIELAHNGIFFLDEIGECSPAVQAKLLRVIQEREIQSLGSVKTKKIETRFFAATNRDLNEMVAEGTFRMDLLQRLNTFTLAIPALRDRPEDIVLYSNNFLAEFAGARAFTLTSCGMDALLSYSWPGNVRELRNIIERMVLLSDRRVIDGELVRSALDVGDRAQARAAVREVDSRSAVLKALEQESGNRTRAAAKLGVHPVTLQRWIKKFGIGDAFAGKPGRPAMLEARTRTEATLKAKL